MFCVAIYLACKQAAESFPHNDGEGNRNYIVAGPLQNRAGCWMRLGAGGRTGCYRFRRRGLPDWNANLNILQFIWGQSNNGNYKNRRGRKDENKVILSCFPFFWSLQFHTLFHFVILRDLLWKHWWFGKLSILQLSNRHCSVLSIAWILLHSFNDLCSALL